jgi:hypothetical protein
MFKVKAYTVNPIHVLCIGLLVIILIVVSSGTPTTHYELDKDGVVREYSAPHQCIDQTHTVCDGECSCDGMECDRNTNPTRVRLLRDYQIELTSGDDNQILIWDGYRLVKTITLSDNCALNQALLEDNE